MSNTMGTTGPAPVQGQTMQSATQSTSISSTTSPYQNQPFAPSSMPVTMTNTGSPQTNQGVQGLTFDQVENYWIQAGGNPQAAQMAAAVADAESGLNPSVSRQNPDGSSGVGLWLIPSNGMPPGTTDPLANARAAIQLSQNGTDWTQWCSTWSDNNCGQNNGTYLGSGANALMSLQTQASTAYNVFGSTPSSNGVGASTATSGLTGGTATSGSSKNLLLLGGLLVVLVVVYVAMRKARPKPEQEQPEAETPQ